MTMRRWIIYNAALVAMFMAGYILGRTQADPPAVAMRLPTVHVDLDSALELELRQCRGLVKEQIEILDDDRKLEDKACSRRIEEIVRERYPKGGQLIIRDRVRQEVGWFVGEGPPKGTCNAGSLYSRSDAGSLYVCEASGWRVK